MKVKLISNILDANTAMANKTGNFLKNREFLF